MVESFVMHEPRNMDLFEEEFEDEQPIVVETTMDESF